MEKKVLILVGAFGDRQTLWFWIYPWRCFSFGINPNADTAQTLGCSTTRSSAGMQHWSHEHLPKTEESMTDGETVGGQWIGGCLAKAAESSGFKTSQL